MKIILHKVVNKQKLTEEEEAAVDARGQFKGRAKGLEQQEEIS